MTLVIQRAEHRDTQAIHAKLDARRPLARALLKTGLPGIQRRFT
jgi:hypothetical protein